MGPDGVHHRPPPQGVGFGEEWCDVLFEFRILRESAKYHQSFHHNASRVIAHGEMVVAAVRARARHMSLGSWQAIHAAEGASSTLIAASYRNYAKRKSAAILIAKTQRECAKRNASRARLQRCVRGHLGRRWSQIIALRQNVLVDRAINEAWLSCSCASGSANGPGFAFNHYHALFSRLYLVNVLEQVEESAQPGLVDPKECTHRLSTDWRKDAGDKEYLDEPAWRAAWLESMEQHSTASTAEAYCKWSAATIKQLTIRGRTRAKARAHARRKVRRLKARLADGDSDDSSSSSDDSDSEEEEEEEEEGEFDTEEQADLGDGAMGDGAEELETRDSATPCVWTPIVLLLRRISRTPEAKAAGLTSTALAKMVRTPSLPPHELSRTRSPA